MSVSAPSVFSAVAPVRDNVSASAATYLISLAPGLVLPFAAATSMSRSNYGLWAFFFSVSTLASVFDLGANYLAQSAGRGATYGCALRLTLLAIPAQIAAFGGLVVAALTVGWPANGQIVVPLTTTFFVLGILRMHQTVLIAVLCAQRRHRDRTIATAVGSVVSIVVGLLVLQVAPSPVSLTVAITIGAFVAVVVMVPTVEPLSGDDPQRLHGEVVRRFAFRRFFVSGLSALLTQGDRIAIMAFGGPAMLAPYDLAGRVVSMAKLPAMALSSGLASEAPGRQSYEVRTVRRALEKTSVALSAVLLTLGFALLTAAYALGVLPYGKAVLVIVPVLGVGHVVHSSTAPMTALAAGKMNASLELRYLAIAAVVAITLLPLAVATESALAMAGVVSAALVVGTVSLFGQRRTRAVLAL